MGGDKFDQLYNALKADGAVQGTREDFRKFACAPGKQGYQNRKRLYDALYADGAISSKSYEEFAQRLGLHAVNPKPRQAKPQTVKEKATQVNNEFSGQKQAAPQQSAPANLGYLDGTAHRQVKSTQPKGKVSPFVQRLYERDNIEEQSAANLDWTDKNTLKDLVASKALGDKVSSRLAVNSIVHNEERRREQPIVSTGTPADKYVVKTRGQLEDEMDESAKKLVNSENKDKDFINSVINQEIFKESNKRALKAVGEVRGINPETAEEDELRRISKANAEFDQGKMIKDLERVVSKRAQEWLNTPETKVRIQNEAMKLGIDVNDYIKENVVPALYNKIAERLPEEDLKRYLPKNRFEYLIGGIGDSTIGTIASMSSMSKEQRQLRQQAIGMTDEGENPNFTPGTWDKAGRGTISFIADAPLYSAAGIGAGAATTKVFGNAAMQAARTANMSLAGRVLTGVGRGVIHGGVTGFQYGMISGAVQNYSTGEDTSICNTIKQALISGASEAASFATMEGVGGAIGGLGFKVGLDGTEKGILPKVNKVGQKLTYEAVKTGMEGMGMASGGVAASYARSLMTGEDFNSFTVEGTLESCASAVIFKMMHAKSMFKREVDPKTGENLGVSASLAIKAANLLSSDAAKSQNYVFTDDEKYQLINANTTGGLAPVKSIFDLAKKVKNTNPEGVDVAEDGSDVLNYYQQIMQDPNVSWDAKAKFSTFVMGTMPQSRPMMDHISVGTEIDVNDGIDRKVVYEYAKDGTLLSKKRYNTIDEREAIIYKNFLRQEEGRRGNAYGLSITLDMNDEALQNAFFQEKAKDANSEAEIQAIVDGMKDPESEIFADYRTFVFGNGRTNKIRDSIADTNGIDKWSFMSVLWVKEPMERTDAEQNACIQYRKALEEQVFPEGKPHEEQSQTQGRDVAEENNLGSSEPKTEAAAAELTNLANSEKAWETAMESDDNLKQGFEDLQKKGFTPAQIYQAMMENGYGTEDALKPLADYINANARVQGMQQRTIEAIEENVDKFAVDWAFHGTFNGEEQSGKQILYVQDKDGRVLIVGSGECAYNTVDGRAREGVGDMLVCIDANKREVVYVKAEDTTLFQNEEPEVLKQKERERLQQINSQPYVEAAQTQAANSESKAQSGDGKEDGQDGNKEKKSLPNDTPTTSSDAEGGASAAPGSEVPSAGEEQGGRSSSDTSKLALTFKNSEKVPTKADSKGRTAPDYDKMTPEQSAEVLTTLFGEDAEKIADARIKKATKAVEDAGKMEIDFSAEDADILEQQEAKKAAVIAAKKQLQKAEAIKAALGKKPENNVGVGTVNNTNKYDAERKQGYRIGEGNVRYDRQKTEDVGGVRGKEINVAFSPTVKIKGYAKLVELNTVQGSHSGGQLNPYHFGHDWQPKDRSSQASKLGAKDMAENIDPEQITGSSNAFLGSAPSVNERHECIQGNNRIEALYKMYYEHPEQAAKYKKYLMDNATKFGFKPEEIAKMKKPVIVNELLVDDTTAKELGQMTADGFETGGSRLPDVNATINRLVQSGKTQSFINKLFEYSGDEDLSFSELVSRNADKALRILSDNGIIDNTGMENLMKDPIERRTWIEKVLKTSLFDGEKDTEKAFETLSSNAQKAVLGTFMRDLKSPEAASIKQNLKNSFAAYNEINSDNEAFRNAKNINVARAAIDRELASGNQSMFEEAPVRERYSTFELELAALYKGLKDQKTLIGLFNDYFDAVQGDKVSGRELELGETLRESISKSDALKEVFKSYDNKPAESQRQVDEAVKSIATEITKGTGLEVVTGDEAQKALDEAEATDSYVKYQTSSEIDKKYPNWLDGTTNDNGKHSTQVAGTIGTYRKVAAWVESHLGKDVKILDASSGMGLGTKELREQGFNIEDVEPYQSEDRKKSNPATYSSYGDIKGKYDFVISNAVLNVIPDDWRSNVLHDMANRLSNGGRLFINTRKAGEEKSIKDKIELDSPQEVLVKRNGRIASYQRFFTPKELKAWVEKELGDGYEVEVATEKNSGTKGLAAVVVTKKEVRNETSPETVAPLPNGNVDASVASRDAVAKIQKNLETTKFHYEKASNRTRGFITDVSRALGLAQHEASQYGTFVSKDGKQFTIRISNHNTRATTFDENGESEGISIVISGSRNKGIRDKENTRAHVVEFFYPKKSIERAEGKPLVSIIESIKETLDTGVYHDKTGIATLEEVDGTMRKEFRSKDGEVYGFTDGEKIYLDTKKMKPETPLHEYAHLWTAALKRANPKEWENVKKIFDEVKGLKDEVQKLYPKLKGDDLYEEMITIFSGREGAKKLEGVARDLATKEGNTVTESAKTQGFIEKVKTALQKYWKGVADMLHIHFTTAEEVADKVLADWAKGVNPNEIKGEEKKEELPEGPTEELNKLDSARKAYQEAKKSANVEQRTKAILDLKQAYIEKIRSKTIKRKDEAWGLVASTKELLLESYGIPYSEYYDTGTVSKSRSIELILGEAERNLEKITGEKLDDATEKQRNYIKSLEPRVYDSIDEVQLNKRQASMLIDHLKNFDINSYGQYEEYERRIEELVDFYRQFAGVEPFDWNYQGGYKGEFTKEQVSDAVVVLDKNKGDIERTRDELNKIYPKYDYHKCLRLTHSALEQKEKADDKIRILPEGGEPDKTFRPIEVAAEEYKKEHPMTEDEIMRVVGLDDESKYTAIDYLNGDDDSEIARICYEQAYNNHKPKNTPVEKVDEYPEGKTPNKPRGNRTATTTATKPKPKTVKEKKADAKKFREERDKETSDLMQQFLAAGKKKESGSSKAFSTIIPIPSKAVEWMEKSLTLSDEQKALLPKLLTAIKGSMYARIKEGVYSLEDVIENVRNDFKAFFGALSEDDANKILAEAAYKGRYTNPETKERIKLSELAERERKLSPEHKSNLFGDSKHAEEKKQKEDNFIGRVKEKLDKEKSGGIRELRKLAEECGLKDVSDTDLQEMAETAVVQKARDIATSRAISNEKKFETIKSVYENQPMLNQRDSERVMKQQYSTPAPYAFLADMYVTEGGKRKVDSALEPSAGNGMLTIGLPKDKVHVNDIDDARLTNLRRQGFKNITNQDGTLPFADKDVDVVVTNPPFGNTTTKEYDGYKISSLEGQMAINALESMKDDGRAAIIIGGTTEYANNGSLKSKDKAFLGYLYSHYNVEDVINVDGSLYAKQGTTYPTRIILINGRRFNENAFPPVKSKARAEVVKDYDELYKRINDDLLLRKRMDSSIGEGAGKTDSELDRPSTSDTHEEGLRMGGRGRSEQKTTVWHGGVSSGPSVSRPENVLGGERRAERETEREISDRSLRADGTGADATTSEGARNNSNSKGRVLEPRGNGRPDSKSVDNGTADTGSGGRLRGLQVEDKPVRGLTTEKVKYTQKSKNPFSLNSVMPADQQEAVNKNLEKLGDVDQFLVDELGYNDKDDLYSHLAAEQIDSVALALHQAKQGNAFIIGDQTGIGKGRQAASLIRYAKKQGQVPIYFTKTAGLLSDVYRDLVDIGNPDLRPFVFGSSKEAAITDSKGKVVFPLPSEGEVQRVLDYIEKNGKLPEEYDYILTTYSQVSNGVFEYDEKGNRKERKIGKNKKFTSVAYNGQKRRDAIEKLVSNGYLILDESHTAGGDSGQGNYFQHIIQEAKNVTFFSATFAKRPDNMPIYALRTAMNKSGMETADLIDAVRRGGVTLQEIMSQVLTKSGQMIRRERDMTGVTIDWKAIDEPEKVQEQREQYDSIIGLFNDIINFQKTYVNRYIDQRNEELAEVQASMGITRGAEALGIKNVPFASKAYNVVQQVLLSLKAKSAAERAIYYLNQGAKPVIALSNTNESQTGEFAMGEEMDAPDLGVSLKRGLEGTLKYTSKDAKDESSSGYIKLEDLGQDAVEAYRALEKKIKETSTGLSLSPIDVIKSELEKAGYKVGELTGRSTEFVYNENGTVTKVKRTDTDKKKIAREFNDGQIDALILNRSAATGISLHASSEFKDQRKRVMIVAQQQPDVNDEVQMRGRIDRTGQVLRGAYEYIVSLIPAEQRILMMFKAKLKSLDANTTSSQKSKFNEMEVADITNKYGDRVVREYMAEHLDIYSKMADPFGWERAFGDDLSAVDPQKLVATPGGTRGNKSAGDDASKLLGRMALLKVKEQEKMLNEISEIYANEIQRLNEMGENDLEITELPLKAKTISKEVWTVGSEPNGDNAFADNTYIEKVNVAILKKPMKADEVKKAQDGLVGGKSWEEYKEQKTTEVKTYFDKRVADETQKYEERAVKIATKAKEKYQKDAKKGQKNSGMSDEQIEKMAGFQYDDVYKREKEKLNDVIKNLNAKRGKFERVLDIFDTNDAYVLPVDMNDPNELSGFGNSYGRLIDIKITDNFSPNASSVSFATLDGRRKITFPVTGMVGVGEKKADVIAAIYRLTRQASSVGDKHLRVLSMDVNNWDRLISNESRKDGYIITGNLLQAMTDTKKQAVGGQLVKYTTEDGEIRTGILMPDRFEPKNLSNEYPISTVAEKFGVPTYKGGIDAIVSSDGNVKINQFYDGWRDKSYYELRVPKSSKKGGKYFLDKELLSMMKRGNFETRGNSMLGEFEEEQLRPVLARLSNLGVKVKEERQSTEGGTHFRTNNASLGNDKQDVVSQHIASVAQKVGANVNIVISADEVTNEQAKAAINAGKKITGWYDEKTGQVYLYTPNIHDRYTAEKTIWHEAVGHKGLRGLFGDNFDKFMRTLWYDMDNPVNTEMKQYVMERIKKEPLSIYDAIEEYLADTAEKGKGEPGFWNGVKNKMLDALHEIGYRIAPNTKDVKYLLWLSKNLQKNPNDPTWRMRAEAVKYQLAKENVSDMIARNGMFAENSNKSNTLNLLDAPKQEYQEATDGEIHFRTTPSTATALDRYHKALDAHGYMFTESMMDNMLSLDKLMRAIDPSIKKIEDVKSSENPYILQNTMQGAMSNAADMFERNVMKPLDSAMGKLLGCFEGKKDDDKIRNFNLYMITKHGLERNRIFYVRDVLRGMMSDHSTKAQAESIEADWYNEKEWLDNELNNGLIHLDEYYMRMDEFIRNHVDKDYEAGEHDYSGLHGVQGLSTRTKSYDDYEAIWSVMDNEANMESYNSGSVKDFWGKVNAATMYSIDTEYKNGVISKELHEHVSNMFNWYVPLRKYDEDTAEDAYGYITETGNPSNYIGSVVMRARGHKYLSETNVLAQIGAMGNRAIQSGGQNAIKQAFARFIRNHTGGNLVTETSVWYVDDPITGITEERYPDIPDDATPDEINDIVSDFNKKMKELELKGLASKKYRRDKIGCKFQRAENKSQHIVDVNIAGRKHTFIVNGNPRAAQALNGLLENKGSKFLKPLSTITRTMAQLCTSYSPEFVVRNIVRDAQFASSNVTAKEGAKYGAKWLGYYTTMMPFGAKDIRVKDIKGSTGLGLYAKYRNGTLDTSNKIHRYFKEFMENGGETGWVQLLSMKDWEKKYKLDIKKERSVINKGGKVISDFFFGNLKNLNEVAENMARFATYCASRDSGRSAVRSAYDAKEVSTNFNRHGSGDAIWSFKNGETGNVKTTARNITGFMASYLRQCSMFFNAGIQSTNLLTKNFRHAWKGTAFCMTGMPFFMGAAAAALNNFLIAGEDEKDRNGVKDPFGELPDYIRRNNLCIYKGGGEFITVPLAIELRAFYGLGDLAAGFTFANNIKTDRPIWADAVGCISQLVPVMDYTNSHAVDKNPLNETIKAFSPSALSPFVEWDLNSDWKGSPIRRESASYNENSPAWQRAYKNTPNAYMELNKWVNAKTNDVAPGNEDMLGNGFLDAVTNPAALNHFTSGFGGGLATFATRLTKLNKDSEVSDIPFVRSFLYEPNEQSSMQRTKSKWYNYVSSMEKSMSNLNRLKSKNVPLDKRLENISAYYSIKDSNVAKKARIIEFAQKYIKRWKKLRDKASDPAVIDNANKNIDLIMQDAVDKLDKLN